MSTYRPKELARRNDAVVVRSEPLDQTRRMAAVGTELLTGPKRWELLGQARRAAERGEVRLIQRDPRWNADAGRWEIRVVRLKEPAAAWTHVLKIVLAITAPIAVLLVLVYWVVTALAALPLAVLCGAALIGLMGLLARGRRPRITMSQRIDIR